MRKNDVSNMQICTCTRILQEKDRRRLVRENFLVFQEAMKRILSSKTTNRRARWRSERESNTHTHIILATSCWLLRLQGSWLKRNTVKP